MRVQIYIISLLITSICYSQSLTEEELAAKWQVQKIVNSPDIPQAKPLIEGFRSATFDLKGSADFKLTTIKSAGALADFPLVFGIQ
jgi:hypothetical protein